MADKIPIAGPSITDKEIEYVRDAAENDWYENAGEFCRRFEEAFAGYLGRKHAVSLPHCTAGLHLALSILEIGAGDEVIVPDITWIATSAPVSYVGATPVFVDIDPETWCLCPEAFERAITEDTKAVIPVDLYGSMPDYDPILEIASEHDIAVIEDAAEAIGSTYKGNPAGSYGDFGVFSFHGSKTLTTGEGGMLVTDDDDYYKQSLFLRDHGRADSQKMFWNSEVAFKYKMSGLQAAIGLAQIERVDELVNKKREIFKEYKKHFDPIKGITLNPEIEGIRNSCWMTTILIDPSYRVEKEELIDHLNSHGVDARPFFYPLSSQPAYQEIDTPDPEDNPASYQISSYGVNLPSALNLTGDQVERVCDLVVGYLRGRELS